MGDFFRNLNLARWIILLSILGSAYLGWNGFRLQGAREDLELALQSGGEVERLAQLTQTLSRQHSKLTRQMEREGFVGQTDPASYVRRIARSAEVAVGGVALGSERRQNPANGIVDKIYSIEPEDRDRGVSRTSLANLFWKLETDSRRVRVTRVHIEPAQKNLKDHEIPNDSWLWSVEITSRQKQ